MNYFIGDLTVPGETDACRENDRGLVVIGGDVCDVYASAAYGNEGEVLLVDVTVFTGFDLSDLAQGELRDELVNMATNAIAHCYASIGRETFIKSRQASLPHEETINVL